MDTGIRLTTPCGSMLNMIEKSYWRMTMAKLFSWYSVKGWLVALTLALFFGCGSRLLALDTISFCKSNLVAGVPHGTIFNTCSVCTSIPIAQPPENLNKVSDESMFCGNYDWNTSKWLSGILWHCCCSPDWAIPAPGKWPGPNGNVVDVLQCTEDDPDYTPAYPPHH